MQVAVIITVATVLIILGLILLAVWLVPKALADEESEEQPPEQSTI